MHHQPKTTYESTSLKVKARHTELPSPQSPQKVEVKLVATKTRTSKSYAQSEAETVPLRAGPLPLRPGEHAV